MFRLYFQVCILSLFLITTYMGLHANAQTANSTDDGQDTPMPTETDTAADSNSTGIDNSENSANTTAGDGASTDSSATTATTTGANDTTTTAKTAETTSAGKL